MVPTRSSSSSWKADPTVPWPSRPTRNGPSSEVTGRQGPVALAPHDDARVAVPAEDHRRPRQRLVVVRQRMAVGPGGRYHEHVPGARVVELDVAYQDVAGFAVLSGDRAELAATQPIGDVGLVACAVEHRPQVVGHAAVDGDVGAHARDPLDGADPVDRDASVADQRPAWLAEHAGILRSPP